MEHTALTFLICFLLVSIKLRYVLTFIVCFLLVTTQLHHCQYPVYQEIQIIHLAPIVVLLPFASSLEVELGWKRICLPYSQ